MSKPTKVDTMKRLLARWLLRLQMWAGVPVSTLYQNIACYFGKRELTCVFTKRKVRGTQMTNLQRKNTAMLRNKGYGIRTIAKMLSVPLSTVKSYCWRNGLSGNRAGQNNCDNASGTARENISVCPQCGALVEQTPHRKQKRFCSDLCRMRWWNGQRSQHKNKKYRRMPHDNSAI